MTNDEWDTICATLAANWPHSPAPDSALDKWRSDLADLPPQQVLVAVEALYRQGREHPPNGAQIRNEVLRLTIDVPDWGDVWRHVLGAVARYPIEEQPLADAWLADWHPLAGQLAAQLDWRELRFSADNVTTKEAQVRGKWDALVRRAQRDGALAGLPSAGLPALKRVNAEPRAIGAEVRRIAQGGP